VVKSHIIAEIQRTAEGNGGVPLGFARFEDVTGIRFADWFGIYWARWGDAVREAGFEPNQLQSAYKREELLQKYAELAKELRRLPVRGDLSLRRRADPEFPSCKTFERIRPKAEFIRQLADYCRSREGLEDVCRWCEGYAASEDRETRGELPKHEGTIGYVYLFKSGRFYKIGKSNSAGRREYELAIQLPERVDTIHVIRTDDPSGIEDYWHRRFAAKRKNGEWFDLEAADVAAFKRHKFM
jgi:Meiotically up-regulated gene 113